jgi:hypothetical protein
MRSIIRLARLALGLISTLLALAISFGAAAAAPRDAGEHLPHTGDIERAFRARQNQLQGAANQLSAENAYATTVSGVIASLKSQGADVTDLENGLARFRNRIAISQAEWQSASSMLSAHTGFDAQGNVVDKDQARKTVESVHADLQQIKQSAQTVKSELDDLFHRYDRINSIHINVPPARDAF